MTKIQIARNSVQALTFTTPGLLHAECSQSRRCGLSPPLACPHRVISFPAPATIPCSRPYLSHALSGMRKISNSSLPNSVSNPLPNQHDIPLLVYHRRIRPSSLSIPTEIRWGIFPHQSPARPLPPHHALIDRAAGARGGRSSGVGTASADGYRIEEVLGTAATWLGKSGQEGLGGRVAGRFHRWISCRI
jgi:hypothetical protein